MQITNLPDKDFINMFTDLQKSIQDLREDFNTDRRPEKEPLIQHLK